MTNQAQNPNIKQKGFIVLPIIIIAIVLIAGGVGGYFYIKNKNVNKSVACTEEAKQCPDGSYVGRVGPKCEFAECPNTSTSIQEQATSTQPVATSTVAIEKKLTGCVQASSIKDYLSKEKVSAESLSDWPESWIEEPSPPIKTNFPDAKMFNVKVPYGQGYMGYMGYMTFPFIKIGDQYCRLTLEDNLKAIFAPIRNEEDALKYYLFINQDLSSSWDRSVIYILKESDYNNEIIKDNSRFCDKNLQAKLNKVTKIKRVTVKDGDGYLLTLVAFSYIGEKTVFFENAYLIRPDGTIRALESGGGELLDCGGGTVGF